MYIPVSIHAKEPWKPTNFPVFDSTGTSLAKCPLACMLLHPVSRHLTHLPFSRVSLRPTDELCSNGYQVLVTNTARDLTHLVHDKELLVAYIKETIGLGDDVKVVEILWHSDFRYVQRFLLYWILKICFGRPNIRMVDKFGVGRVFVAGGMSLRD